MRKQASFASRSPRLRNFCVLVASLMFALLPLAADGDAAAFIAKIEGRQIPDREGFDPFTLDELWRQAIARRPDYQAALRDQARSVAELRLQIAQGKVDFVIGAEYRRQQGLAGTGNSLGFFFSAPLPLFNRNQGEIARAGRERTSSWPPRP